MSRVTTRLVQASKNNRTSAVLYRTAAVAENQGRNYDASPDTPFSQPLALALRRDLFLLYLDLYQPNAIIVTDGGLTGPGNVDVLDDSYCTYQQRQLGRRGWLLLPERRKLGGH